MYVIGEIGINHNGDINLALQMINIAKQAGCNCVKFQKRNPDVCVPEDQKNKPRTFLGEEMTYLEYKKKLEFGKEEYDMINEYCHQLDIQWTASVWDVDSVEFMKQYINDIPFIKIPSACITDMELLDAVNEMGIDVIMSNGMSTQEEVDCAIHKLDHLIGLLHCNSSYPCEYNELDLRVIQLYRTIYPELAIGYSGHEIGYMPTLIAYSLGATVIERHITIDKTIEGTDQQASLEPTELAEMIDGLSLIDEMLGNMTLHVYPSEEKVKEKLRR